VRRASAVTAGALIALAGAAFAVLATSRRRDPALYPPAEGEPFVEVFVVASPLHANLAVPAAALRGEGPAAQAAAMLPAPGPWLMLGWGDARHYRERGRTLLRQLDLWRSFLAPNNPTVLHLQPLAAGPTPETLGRRVLRLRLSRPGFEHLQARLDRSFTLSEGRPLVAGRGRSPDALFFYGVERGDIAHVCNHWVADLLGAAGVPTSRLIDTSAPGLLWDLRTRGGAVEAHGDPGASAELGLETPPAYSGRFRPTGGAGGRLRDLHLDGYRLRLGAGPWWTTTPLALLTADVEQAPGRSWAGLLKVDGTSLVELRGVTSGGVGLREGPVGSLAIGFHPGGGLRYELVVAAFSNADATGEPQTVIGFRQP
jgi:hypothetical protein